MKLLWVVLVFCAVLASVGVACGPNEPYCYNEHKACSVVKSERILLDMQASDADDGGTAHDVIFVDL